MHSGFRLRTYGHGIEGVQAHNITIYDTYIHDVPGESVREGPVLPRSERE
jgi:hypothetical protein